MHIDEVQLVGIVGAGTMGREIGFRIALAGLDVVVYDQDKGALNTLKARLEQRFSAQTGEDIPPISTDQLNASLSRISVTTSIEDMADVDLISESVYEELSVKQQVWEKLGDICSSKTIFTTNTSSLAPSTYAASTGRPELFVAMHFHLPIEVNRIVDVMTHGQTSPDTMNLVEAFVMRVDLVPIRIEKESPGYLFNAMLIGYMKEALRLLSSGVGSLEDIDRVWTSVMGVPTGPFVSMDYVGIDTVWRIIQGIADRDRDSDTARSAAYLKNMVDTGRLGMKSGRGFYDYPSME